MLFSALPKIRFNFFHLFDFYFLVENYFLAIIFFLLFLLITYFFRVKKIKSNQRKLEFLVNKRTKLISKQKNQIEIQNNLVKLEKSKSDKLLLNVLPDYVVEELKKKGEFNIK